MKPIHPTALFRLSVIGELTSRQRLVRGELKAIVNAIAEKHYDIPHSQHTRVSPKTIEAWYYAWKEGGIEALAPKPRSDRGLSRLPEDVQAFLIEAKQENPKRSINALITLAKLKGVVKPRELSRSGVYRLLLAHGLSRPEGSATQAREFRSFLADYPGDLVYGDVMHGPKVLINGQVRKCYLVTLMDDVSRLILHSAFCPGETALDIEAGLKQALLKRGVPKRIVLDQGAAYRSRSLQGICARLSIQLIYCRPYSPEGKGKLERWHRTLRDQFLTELPGRDLTLDELNSFLWAWLDQLYHNQPHTGLQGQTPRKVWQQGLSLVRPLGALALRLDEIFYHRVSRKVRKDGTVSYQGQRFEVPCELSGKTVVLVVDPHQEQALFVESGEGVRLGQVTPLDLIANRHRQRQPSTSMSAQENKLNLSLVELAHDKQSRQLSVSPLKEPKTDV